MESVNTLKEQNKVWNGELGKIGSMRLYRLEEKIVEELFRLMNAERREIPENWEDRVRQAEILQGWEYEDEQIEAIKIILESNVCIITGWAGVGKTATVLGALKALGDISFGMSALSGKASSVLQDSTGYESHTIHRLLRFKEGVFEHNKENPLPYDVVILDETSMVNGNLFYSLIQSIKTGAKFIIMGDVNQIPPIGSLNIFHDLLKSSVVPSRKLTKIHRQARKSGIITNSIQIARGEQLIEKGFEGKETRGELQDFHIDIFDKSWKTFDKVIETFKEKLETVKDYTKISVIVPFNFNGDVSCYNINKTLQEICNPPNPKKNEVEISYAKGKEVIIREGDLVLNTVNNYKLKAVVENDMGFEEVPIFNGFIGTVEKIWHNGNIEIYFHMIDKRVIVTKSHWSEKKAIQHGYCISIHKAQGSQNDYIIVGMDFTHYKMLTSELLYTAITRAKKDCVLISTTQALSHAIRTKDSTQKQTFMVKFLNCKNKLKTEVE
jgi:exodeoxyribonuclease V alpha subunit